VVAIVPARTGGIGQGNVMTSKRLAGIALAATLVAILAAVLAATLAAVTAIGPARAAELPAAIRQAGVLHLTINATYAPMEYHDPATDRLTGLDVDLAEALAKRLGVKPVWSDVPFEQLIPALQTGRSDFIISGFSDRASRRDGADFVDYLKIGPQFFVLAASPVKAMADLCGIKVGTTRSTSFPIEIAKWSKSNCEAAGKPAIQYVPGENSIDVRSQLKQGRIDAAVQGSETLPYAQANEPGVYRIIGAPIAQGYQGIAFRKTDTALRAAITDALRAMIADGTYTAILTRYGLAANGVAEPLLNASPQ
jgi:polar amino acid transport system substrate-binding protein